MTVTIINEGKTSPYNLDDNIKSLVLAINSLPGINSCGSCGGHDNPEIHQHKTGNWFVSFWAVGLDGQFWLNKIIAIVAHIDDVSFYHDALGWYSIDGINHIDPNVIVTKIESVALRGDLSDLGHDLVST